jgi:Flp pilus assembly protein CpaB
MTTLDRVSSYLWRNSERIRWSAVILLLAMAGVGFVAGEEPEPTQLVTVAAIDIASGSTLRAQDVTTKPDSLGLSTVPVEQTVGEMARGPIQAGEPVTRSRLAPRRSADLDTGLVVFPLWLPTSEVASLLRAGDRIDVLVPGSEFDESPATTFASDIEVLAIPEPADDQLVGTSTPRSLALVSATQSQALALASLKEGQSLSIAIR